MRKPSKATVAKAVAAGAVVFGAPTDKSVYSRGTYALAQYRTIREHYDTFQDWRKNRDKFTIIIRQDSAVYPVVSEILFSGTQEQIARNIELDRRYSAESDQYQVISLAVDSQMYHSIVDGHKYTFTARYPENPSESRMTEMVSLEKELVVTAYSQAGKDALIARVEKAHEGNRPAKRKACVWTYRRGSWERMSAPLRPLESVVLKDGYIEHLEDDIQKFFDAEDQYVNRGLPWHRGYLFDGPPGSGKTSLAKGLAHKFNIDLFYLAVSDLESNADLISRVSEIHAKGILLLEDVDTIAATHERSSDKGKTVDMGGLLNVLDGAVTPHGLLTVMTTNHKESLDPAVIRPGRVDMNYHIGYCDDEQANRLFVHFYDQEPTEPLVLPSDTISTAQLTELFKRYMYDPATAERLISSVNTLEVDDHVVESKAAISNKEGRTRVRPGRVNQAEAQRIIDEAKNSAPLQTWELEQLGQA